MLLLYCCSIYPSLLSINTGKFLREQNGSGKRTAEVVVGAPEDGNYDGDEGVNRGEDDADGSDDEDDGDEGVNSGEDDADGSDDEDDGDSEDDGNSSDDTLTEMCAKLVVSHQPSPSPRPEMPSDESLTKHHDFITS